MNDFLLHLHNEISRLLLIGEDLLPEEKQLLDSIIETIWLLERFAEVSKNKKLYQITEDLDYAIRHFRVPFKAEAALKDAATNIAAYK